jgi:hypothetical protein
MPLFFLLATSCISDKNQNPANEDNFETDSSLRVLEPSNGDVVDSPFEVVYEVGSDIDSIRVDVNNMTNQYIEDVESGVFELELGQGNKSLRIVGLDSEGDQLSVRNLTVTVEPENHWVAIISPADGETVQNPVHFVVNASGELDSIELLADDYSLGFTEPGIALDYEFTGMGYPRNITARGYFDGELQAEDEIQITVEAGTQPIDSDFSSLVVDMLETYPADGTFGYYWPEGSGWLGTTQDIWYMDELVAEGDVLNRSYCVGLTWEVFMRVWAQVDGQTGDGSINGMDVYDLHDFRIDWFVRDLYGSGVGEAVENFGIGEVVTDWSDIQPGDFLQFWRNNGSGHSNIFIDWERDSEDRITGVKYWSTQNSTDGVGYNTEYFGTSSSNIDAYYFFAARVYMPEDWIPWY